MTGLEHKTKEKKTDFMIGKGDKMKKLLNAILIGTAMFGTAALMGAEFRIDVQAAQNASGLVFKGGSEGVRGSKAAWLKENADCRLLIKGKAGENWEEKSFQFIAKKDCWINLNFMGDSDGKNLFWVAYDNVRVEGAELKNGSFELVNPQNGLPVNWGTYTQSKMVFETGDDAADGKKYIEATHNHRATQGFRCSKGTLVKVTFMVRDAKRSTPIKK